jgi:hypothetical protein
MCETLKVQALDCCNCCRGSMGPSIAMLHKDTCSQNPRRSWSDCRSKMIPQVIWIWGACDSVPPRSVLLQGHASFVPKESQHNLPCRWLRPDVLDFGDEEWRHPLRVLSVSGFTFSLIKKRITERYSSFVHVSSGAVIFKPALWWRSVCLPALFDTYRILVTALVTCMPTYRTIARYLEFLSQFYSFLWLTYVHGWCLIWGAWLQNTIPHPLYNPCQNLHLHKKCVPALNLLRIMPRRLMVEWML